MSGLWVLPPTWRWPEFGEVAEVDSNLVDPSKYPDYPHVAPNHIESNTGCLLEYTTVAEDKVTSAKHLFRPGHILYSKIRPYLAKAAVVDFAGQCSADMYPISTELETRFLHRWLISPMFTEQAANNQGRTVLPKINQNALATLPVPVPERSEQRRIVAKLESLQARSRRAREALQAVPPLLEKLRQSILAAAFRGDLTADWREQHPDVEPASELLKRIRTERRKKWEQAELAKLKAKGKTPTDDKWRQKYVEPEPVNESELPELPAGWGWARADEVVEPGVDIVYGIVQPGTIVSDGVPYVRGMDIQDGVILEKQLLRTAPSIAARYERASLRGGDVLLGIIRATKVAVVPKSLDGANITQGTVRFRPTTELVTEFLAGWLDSPFSQNWFHSHYRGIDMPGLNVQDVRQLPVPIAPIREQHAVCNALNVALRRINVLRASAKESKDSAKSLDSAILSKAFRGELVPQDPNDASAPRSDAR